MESNDLSAAGTFGKEWQPSEASMVPVNWIFTWKWDERGSVVKTKASLVVRSCSLREGTDFLETSDPTPLTICSRLLASVVCGFVFVFV